MTICQRHLVCIASIAVTVVVGKRFVSVEEADDAGEATPVFLVPVLPGMPERREQGKIECFVSGAWNVFSLVVSVNGQAVGCAHLHDLDAEQKGLFTSLYRFDLDTLEKRDAVFDEAVDIVAERLDVHRHLKRIIELSEGVTERVFCGGALMHVPPGSRASVEALMTDRGMYSLLDGDYQQLEGLAAMSMACSLWPYVHRAGIDQHLSTRGHSFDDVRESCDAVAQSTGFHALLEVDDDIFSLV